LLTTRLNYPQKATEGGGHGRRKHTILHLWFDEVWHERRTEIVGEMIAPESVARGLDDPSDNLVRGAENSRSFFTAFAVFSPASTSLRRKRFPETSSSPIAESP
jgi:hypothetical protein